MTNIELQFEKTFKIATTFLLLNRSHPAVLRNKFWVFQFIIISSITLACFFFLSNSFLFHDVQAGRYNEASKNGTMVIVSITITFKYIILLYHQESIKSLIRVLDTDYEIASEMSSEERNVVKEYAQKGVQVCQFWLVSALGTCLLFPIKALALMAYYHWKGEFRLVPMFDMVYPKVIEKYKDLIPVFCLLFCMCIFFDCYASSMYIGFDPIVPIFMLHTCGQLELLSQRISRVFSVSRNPRDIEQDLKAIVRKLQDIYRFVNEVKNNFSILYEYNMKTTTFLLPLTAFQVVEDLKHAKLNLEFICFFTGCILHFFMPSYYSDLLMEKSESFRQSIYSCGWENCSHKEVRQIILFMITRATQPLGISTVFSAICLDTFAEMCRQSYAILNLMNAAWV